MASEAEVLAAEAAVKAEWEQLCTEIGLKKAPITVISPTNHRLLRAAIDAADAVRTLATERTLQADYTRHPHCTTVNHAGHE
jgi:hypothetical protein